MAELRIVRKLFAYTAFLFVLVFLFMLPMVIRAPFPHATSHSRFDLLGMILILMRETILFMPPVLALANGMAWWAVKSGSPSARSWAMTSSSLFLAFSVPFFVADIVIFEYAMTGTVAIVGVFLSSLIFSGIGITGLAFFSHSRALSPALAAVPHPAS
jgi:hypothetical protein